MRHEQLNDLAIINEWLTGFTPKTAIGYMNDIATFRDHVQAPLSAVTAEMIDRFISSAQCPSLIVRKRRLAAIRGLYRFGYDKGYLDHDPGAAVSAIAPLEEKPPVVLREADVMRLLRHARNDREYIIIGMAYYAALSADEIAALLWQDLDAQTIRVAGDNARIVHLPDHFWRVIMRYGDSGYHEDTYPVFLSRSRGAGLSARQVNRIINMTSIAARIPGEPANARILRASHAHHAFLRGAGIDAVREILHTTAKSTVRYRPASQQQREIVRTGDLLPRVKG